MNKLLYHLLTMLVLCVISCGREEDELDPETGIGEVTDPKMNVNSYTFPVEGGELDIYSTLETPVSLYILDVDDDDAIVTRLVGDFTNVKNYTYGCVIESSWYYIYNNVFEEIPIQIEVQPNDTGEEREIKITICHEAYQCTPKLVQAAE